MSSQILSVCTNKLLDDLTRNLGNDLAYQLAKLGVITDVSDRLGKSASEHSFESSPNPLDTVELARVRWKQTKREVLVNPFSQVLTDMSRVIV